MAQSFEQFLEDLINDDLSVIYRHAWLHMRLEPEFMHSVNPYLPTIQPDHWAMYEAGRRDSIAHMMDQDWSRPY